MMDDYELPVPDNVIVEVESEVEKVDKTKEIERHQTGFSITFPHPAMTGDVTITRRSNFWVK
jgi:hypothetical protein